MSTHQFILQCPNDECSEGRVILTFDVTIGYPATLEEPGCPTYATLEDEECPACKHEFTQREKAQLEEESMNGAQGQDDPRGEPEYWEDR